MSPKVARPSVRWRRWFVLAACQLLVIVLLAEVAVRVAATRNRNLRMVLHASADATDFSDAETLPELMERTMLGFSPFAVEYGFVLNSRSFRTREYVPDQPFDGLRVVALGDSFTFASGGLPHEHHWTTIAERRLGKRMDQPVEILRMGVPGTGPAFQLRMWEVEAAGLEPDVVILGFFVGNDFVDHRGDCGELCGGDRGFAAGPASISALYRAGRNLIRIRQARGDWDETATGAPDAVPAPAGEPVPGYRESFNPDRPSFRREEFIAIEARRMALCLRSEEDAFEELLALAADEVLQLVAEVEGSGARCVVMLIPDQYQVDDGLVDEVLRATGNHREDYDLDRPQRRFAGVLEGEGAEVLDLLRVFRSKADRGALYRPFDTHWNRRGNSVAAAALTRFLTSAPPVDSADVFGDSFEGGSADSWRR